MPKYDFILMDVVTNPAVRFIDVKGKVWNNVTKAMVDAGTYADTAIILTKDAFINGIPVFIPEDLPAGNYHMVFYDAAAPANTDAYERWFVMGWNDNSRELCYVKDMAPMA